MMKKMLMMVLLLGVISVSGCHTAHRTSVRAGYYYDPYPYSVSYVDPRFYSGPYFHPAYFYDPYPYFFFRSDFLFFEPSRHIFIDDDRSSRSGPNLRGGRGSGGRRSFGGSSSPGPSSPAPAPAPAPQRNLR
jgi:hypothetical protein